VIDWEPINHADDATVADARHSDDYASLCRRVEQGHTEIIGDGPAIPVRLIPILDGPRHRAEKPKRGLLRVVLGVVGL
jgi:hypothetical protein